MTSDQDRQRAETIIKKEERARDGAAAMIEYQAKAIATREKTAHLKALRLDREAQTAEVYLADAVGTRRSAKRAPPGRGRTKVIFTKANTDE
jgi:hypothetical protein